MFDEMTAGWMILIALVVGTVLVLGRTHRRADPHSWTPAVADSDADRRRGRQELRLIATGRSVLDGIVRVGSDTSRAARFDRARAELLEPGPRAGAAAKDHRLAA